MRGAQAIQRQATDKAVEIGVPMTVAVVDDGGSLKAILRMNGAPHGSID